MNPIDVDGKVNKIPNQAMDSHLFLPTNFPEEYQLKFHQYLTSPVKIAAIEILRADLGSPLSFLRTRKHQTIYFIRTVSTDGAIGISIAHQRLIFGSPTHRNKEKTPSSRRMNDDVANQSYYD